MILWALFLAIGFVLGAMAPDSLRDWVRGGAGWVRARVFGSRPAPAPDTLMAAAAPAPSFGTAFANIARFFGGVIAWIVRNPMLALAIVLLAAFLVFGRSCSPFGLGFGKSREELRLEAQLAQAEADTQRALRSRDAVIAQAARDTALLRQRIRDASNRGREAIDAATPEHEEPLDPGLVAAWRGALDGLCVRRPDGNLSDSCSP